MTFAKRAFDLMFSLPGVAVCSPIFVLVAIAIVVDDGFPVFFRQQRVGLHGRTFRMWKFRTMVKNAESVGPALTVGRDPRITRVGRFLRGSKLDELPQLFNVIGGEMSLVGPRPEVLRYVALYDEEMRDVLELVPGITDPASIEFTDESAVLATASDPERFYVETIMPKKIRLNLSYAAKSSVWRDFVVIMQTFARLMPVSQNLGGAQ